MARHYIAVKQKLAAERAKQRQEERAVRAADTLLDEKCIHLEEKIKASDERAAGLTATLEDVIEGNKKLVESVLNLMDTAKLKEGPNTTKRKLQKLEAKYGQNRGR